MRTIGIAAATALLVMATPVLADVKAGVDAWQRGDYRTAVEEWRGPAVAGDADAQFNLGQAYKLGRGVPVDPGLAESWFRKAALQKHPQAEDNYGLALFQSGRKDEALPWLEKSVARGEPRAQLVLGTMLFNGDSVKRDYPRAYALMTRASQAGLTSASETLAQMDGYISPADREKGVALSRTLAAAPQPPADGISIRPAPAPTQVAAVKPDRAAPPKTKPAPVVADKAKPAEKAKPALVVAERPKPKPTPIVAKPAPAGRYRVQLGAFADADNAKTLWSRVGNKFGGSPSYTKAGKLTRVTAGAFASEADAKKACSAAKLTCIVVAP